MTMITTTTTYQSTYQYKIQLFSGTIQGWFHDLYRARKALNRNPEGKSLIRVSDDAVISVKNPPRPVLDEEEFLEQLRRRGIE